ncbi:MAG: RagB/SusD family nutrient uptake outer membrane protein [Muribaculaceae bacterium]|nr:RagB/SusD family nutrient uptake outer membrane protein [Muribaculaceae bacterium]
MKTIKYIGGLLAAAAIAVSAPACTDLDEVTYTQIDASVYYENENSVKGAVASIYSSAQSGFLEYFWYLNEFPADQIAWRTWNGGLWGYDDAAKFVLSSQTWNSESVIIRQAWEHAWETIGLCNTLIADLEAINPASIGMTEDGLKAYIAEVRTIRAWAYYNNFELWGGALPLNMEAPGSEIPGSVDPDFTTGCKIIWQTIADELDACWADLPQETGNNATRTRMNQAANRMLKMRLLLNSQLWQGVDKYAECATLAQEIIDGKYGQYNLVSDYRTIYNPDNYSCPEVVFGFAMMVGQQTNNNRNTPGLPYNYDEFLGYPTEQSGWNCICLAPSKDNSGTKFTTGGGSDDFCGSTGAKSFIFDYGDKLGAPFDRMNDADIRKQPFHSDAAGNWSGMFLMGAQTNRETGAAVMADADLDGQPLIYVDQCGTFSNLGRTLETVMSPRWGMTNTGYRVLRYPILPQSSGLEWRNSAQVEFRLAEVYYTLAECKLRAGDTNAAKTLVNEVRQRYFTNSSVLDQPGPGFTQFDADWMLSEWGLEYLDEGRRRRTDLRRFDKFTQVQWWFFGRTNESDRDLPAKRDRKYEWYPLPQTALMVNPGLVQNPNY